LNRSCKKWQIIDKLFLALSKYFAVDKPANPGLIWKMYQPTKTGIKTPSLSLNISSEKTPKNLTILKY